MDVVYKKLNALMTPEALAQLGEALSLIHI